MEKQQWCGCQVARSSSVHVGCNGIPAAAFTVHAAASCCICCCRLAAKHMASAAAHTADASAGAPVTSEKKAHPAPLIPAQLTPLLHPIYSVQCTGVSPGAPALLCLPGTGLLQLLSRPHSDPVRCHRLQGSPSQLASTAQVSRVDKARRRVSKVALLTYRVTAAAGFAFAACRGMCDHNRECKQPLPPCSVEGNKLLLKTCNSPPPTCL